MSYEPTVWSDGDTITSEKLNKLENRIDSLTQGGDFFIVNLSISIAEQHLVYDGIQEDRRTLNFETDKTESEINDALSNNMVLLFCFTIEDDDITNIANPPLVGQYAMIPSVRVVSGLETDINSYEFIIWIPNNPMMARPEVDLYPLPKPPDGSDTHYGGTW